MSASAPTPARLRDRSRRAPRMPRGVLRKIVPFGLALAAVGGIGAATTVAAWTGHATFGATATVPGFQMQYSWYHAEGTWEPFPVGSDGADSYVPLENLWQWVDPDTAVPVTHYIFIRNVGWSYTRVTLTPELTDAFETADFLQIWTGPNVAGAQRRQWTGEPIVVDVDPGQSVKVELLFNPKKLDKKSEVQTGEFALKVSGETVSPSGDTP